MAVSVTLNSVRKDDSGRVRFRFAMPGGAEEEEREFESATAASDYARSLLTREQLIALAIGLVLTRQPALGNPEVFAGHGLTLDLAQANWGTIT